MFHVWTNIITTFVEDPPRSTICASFYYFRDALDWACIRSDDESLTLVVTGRSGYYSVYSNGAWIGGSGSKSNPTLPAVRRGREAVREAL